MKRQKPNFMRDWFDEFTPFEKWWNRKMERLNWKRWIRNELETVKTNDEVLLEHLQAGNIVTTRTAPDEIGIADVRANIRNLRNAGYDIKDRWVTAPNRRGRMIRYKEYYLEA